MNSNLALWVLFFIALIMANWPFLSQRKFLFLKNKNEYGFKSFSFRIFEWMILYILLGILVFLLEKQLGQAHAQGWEFYVITLALFAILAFPGFTYRYLYKTRVV